jgi:hypothetical protein
LLVVSRHFFDPIDSGFDQEQPKSLEVSSKVWGLKPRPKGRLYSISLTSSQDICKL